LSDFSVYTVSELVHDYVANNTVLQITRSSAEAERPRDASCHWIFC